MHITNKNLFYNIIFFLIYFILSIITFTVVNDFLHLFLVWNLFLATIPYGIVYFLDRGWFKKKWMKVLALVLWLCFFPNATYIITDLIYINANDFFTRAHAYAPLVYEQTLEGYLAMFHIYLGGILGVTYGFKSLFVLYDLSRETKAKAYRNIGLVVVFGLSSIGIYIGRFFRYNSWEILKVFQILKDFFSSFSWFTVFFVAALTFLQILLFFIIRINFMKKTTE